MRRALFILIPIFITAFGCEDNDVNHTVQGSWKIVSISGTIAGTRVIRYFDHLIISDHVGYKVLFNDDVIQHGLYEIQQKSVGKQGKFDYFLFLKEADNNKPDANFYSNYPLKISFDGENSLTLEQYGITDGFVYHFVRD